MSKDNKMKYQDWHALALELYEKGLSGRKIAKALGRGKSQTNDFLKAYREGLVEDKEAGFKTPKIMFLDVETALMKGYFFKIFDENIPMTRVEKQSHLLTAAWAVNDGEVESVKLSAEDVRTGNDLEIVTKLVEKIHECDIIVGFNSKKFDLKVLNTRALFWGLPPVAPKKHIDLFEQAKRNFKFPSNSMQNISRYLGLDGKLATGGTLLWERCADHSNKDVCNAALLEMETYNKQDIEATRDLYKRFLGWGKSQANVGAIVKALNKNKPELEHTPLCTHCGSDDVTKIIQDGDAKQHYTAVSSFDLYRCGNKECRGVSRINASGKNLVNAI